MTRLERVIGHLANARAELLEGEKACAETEQAPYPNENTLLFIDTALMWAGQTKRTLSLDKDPDKSRG